ncbi:MAG: PIN domain-containing protein [Dehalococcoidia bacterium]|nr:PIN domain-containing protein [Dehalococcoidia bacterium]
MIVVDASLVLKLVFDEDDGDVARSLWQEWVDQGEEIAAPILLRAETLSAVRRRVYSGLLTYDQGQAAYAILDDPAVELLDPSGLYILARDLAERFNRPTIYDCCYLALGELIGCPLWTADQRFVNAIRRHFPQVNLLGDK